MDGKNGNERIVHRQQFQNSTNSVEVIVRSKPKSAYLKNKDKGKFSRNCLLMAELNKDSGKENLESNEKSKKRGKFSNIEIYKKNSALGNPIKDHKFLNPDDSWGEFFGKMKESKSISLPKNISKSKEIDTKLSKEISSENESDYSSDYSMVDQAVQTSLIHGREKVGMFEDKYLNEKNIRNKHIFPQNFCQVIKGQDQSLYEERHSKLNRYTHQEVISGQNQILGKISEDVDTENETHSPFGASGLLLLQQLKEKLRSRGDSENPDVVEILDALISAQGNSFSNVKMNIKNKLNYGSSSTPGYPPVFATPKDVSNVVLDKLNFHIKNQNAKIAEHQQTIKELKEFSARLLHHYEENTKNFIKKDGFDEETIEKSEDSAAVNIEEYEKIMRTMKLEIDSLGEENQRQKDLIFKLEVKLSGFENKQKYFVPLTMRPVTRSSLSNNLPSNCDRDLETIGSGNSLAENKNVRSCNQNTENQRPETATSKTKKILNIKKNIDSDGDSAFDEDRSTNTEIQRVQYDTSSSRGTSRLSHNFGSLIQHPLNQKSSGSQNEVNFGREVGKGNRISLERHSKNIYPYNLNYESQTLGNLSLTLSDYTTHNNSYIDGILESHLNDAAKEESTQDRERAAFENMSVQRGHGRYPVPNLPDESYISDSPIVQHADRYLESTHLKDCQEHQRPMYSMNCMSSDYVMEPVEPESTRASL